MKADRELFVLNSEIYNKFNVNVGNRSVLFVTYATRDVLHERAKESNVCRALCYEGHWITYITPGPGRLKTTGKLEKEVRKKRNGWLITLFIG